jgi:hypothetical protein
VATFRAVPVPPDLLDTLAMVHGLREVHRRGATKAPLWPWSRMTAFRANITTRAPTRLIRDGRPVAGDGASEK